MLGCNSDLEFKWILAQPSLSAFMAPKFYLRICSYDEDIKVSAGMASSAHHSLTLGAKELCFCMFHLQTSSELIYLNTYSR